MQNRISRRRVITMLAAAGAIPLAGASEHASGTQRVEWRGLAMGAEAQIMLEHPYESEAKFALAECVAELERLEAIFSLYRTESALVRLNREGALVHAPAELLALISSALHLSHLSDGAFDPTVQPIWSLYHEHFSSVSAEPEGPGRKQIEAVRRLIGWQGITIEADTVRLTRPGMSLTLNGIAQGFITDRIGDLLRRKGFNHVLIDLGEQLALGPRSEGGPWRVGIAHPEDRQSVLEQIALTDGAVATSAPKGLKLDARGTFTHILDPKTGRPSDAYSSVTVLAQSATVADGLSTAISALPAANNDVVQRLAARYDARVYTLPRGSSLGSWLA